MPQKTIIALQGEPNTGKSITIGILYEFVQRNGFTIVQDKKRKNSKDFFVIVKKNGVLIGISSYGDTEFWIKDRCGRFVIAKCSIMVCACHMKGKTIDAVCSFRDYHPLFVPKTTAATKSRQDSANIEDAQTLLDTINRLIA